MSLVAVVMCQKVLLLLILATHSRPCPQHQRAFRSSCYEMVGVQRSFFGAQAWCEGAGGHLAFIPDEDTQHFLQRHLDPGTDAWFGVAASGSANLQRSAADAGDPSPPGPLSWLDGSRVTYSNWVRSPQPGAACGHILRNSGFRWEAVKACDTGMHFICQFEAGSFIACTGRDPALLCRSGQVLTIGAGLYGRGNAHYCRSATAHQRCGWVDVSEALAAHCNGHQVCQVAEAVTSFDDPCPRPGSYLSVDYQCKDGLTLTTSRVAAVSKDVSISIKWLLDLSWGSVTCRLSTGDGHVIHLDSLEGLETSLVHRFTHASTYVVAAACSRNDMHITAQERITIQEPVTEMGIVRCYAANQSFHATHCKALRGETFQLEMRVRTGTNVTYRIQKGRLLLASSSVDRGNVPHNVTLSRDTGNELGPGCHQLTLHASNAVTIPGAFTDLQVCVLEKAAGLQASLLSHRQDCLDSSDITVGVSLEQGAPVLLHFCLTGDNNSSFCETREMTTRKEIFHIGHQLEGTMHVKLRAWNVFSLLEVDMMSFYDEDSAHDVHKRPSFTVTPFQGNQRHKRVVRSTTNIIAKPSSSVETRNTAITLSTSNPSELSDSSTQYEWSCGNPCKCQGRVNGLSYTITQDCLPDPYQFNKYYFKVINKSNNSVELSESICIIFAPKPNVPDWLSLTCTQGCDPGNENTDAIFQLDCKGNPQCQNIVWNIDAPSDSDWPSETQSCYQNAKMRPLLLKQNGGAQFTVSYGDINMARSMQQDLSVVIFSEDTAHIYTTYTIKTSSSTNGQRFTSATASDTSSRGDPGQYPFTTTREPGFSGVTTKAGSRNWNPTTLPTSARTTTKTGTTKWKSTTRPTSARTTKTGTTKWKSTTRPTSTRTTTKAGTTKWKPTTRPITTPSRISANTVTTKTASTSRKTSPATRLNLSCSILPSNGTTLDAFNITCRTNSLCSNCRYCFRVKDKYLRCSLSNEVKFVFLPVGDNRTNYTLIITATVKRGSLVVTTTATTQVTQPAAASVDVLKALVESSLAQLKAQGLLSGETIGPLFSSVCGELNSPSTESTEADKQKLREQMLNVMIDAVNEAPAKSAEAVQAAAGGLRALVHGGSELSSSAQELASLLFVNLSSSLLHVGLPNSQDEMNCAASTIVAGASEMLELSSNKNTTGAILTALFNIQSALLTFHTVNEAATIIQEANIAVFVKRVKPGSLHTEPISIPNCSCPAFSLPVLPPTLFPSQDPVDIRMLSLNKNPFSWNGRGNISGPIGGLTLTTADCSIIPVENLAEDIEILLPRPTGEQVDISVLDLGNCSTTVIDVPSADDTLLIKMMPSKDPLPFKLYLGYMTYPTGTNYVAMTEMPRDGTTPEERYTWLLDPGILKGNTGIYYLLVRPIVGPGIKSINATLSITSIRASCKFWRESASDWGTYGCRVGVNTTRLVTQCLCNHLTFFGSSFFVTPNLVDPSRSAELFATFAQNPVVVCFVGALFGAYFVVVVWARRKDIQDKAKVTVTILDDNNPMDKCRYLLTVSTGYRRGASTSSQVTITLLGSDGSSEPHHLTDRKKRVFERGAVDVFLVTTPLSLGELRAVRLWHSNSGRRPAWFVGNVTVQDLQTDQKWHFLCDTWLAVDMGGGVLDKTFPVSTETDLKRFRNLFFTKATKDFNDGHLWFSVISRPASSSFTCVQRVSCCFSLLLCTMLTSIMFYGIPTDPSEQVMELGHFEFTWQQFMIGVQSSLIMFPVNLLIVTIFRQTRPREMSCCTCRTGKADALEPESTATTNMKATVSLDSIISDITRVAHSLSENVKSNIPRQVGPGQQVDITDVLSVLEDFIRQNNRSSDTTQTKAKSLSSVAHPQTRESNDDGHPGSTVDGIQKKSNKSQDLYRQLCHIHEEVSLLGPSGFPSPHGYNQALQQVQRMKAFVEDQLFTSSSIDQTRSSRADMSGGSQGTETCCRAGLPWWFIFVGWLLVISTSVVAGYFTMLYGLKFGKPKSINWLVSMMISFFQSLLIIQPVKVLCLAVFFALVIKKFDEDDLQNVTYLKTHTYLATGGVNEQQAVRRTGNVYEPPPPAEVEKMKQKKLMEQKAFALFTEILIYLLFMTTLLLVAYTQRDPNAFYLNQHIIDSFSRAVSSCMSFEDVYIWANTTLLGSLFGAHPGFITDGNSKLLGNARLRQLRVKPSSCQTAGPMLQHVSDCNALYSWEVEDRGSYSPAWSRTARDNVSAHTFSPWTYQTQAQLRARSVWGALALYRAGGFVAELGPDLTSASSTLQSLFSNKWLDAYTRAIFAEFTVFNANVNLFCIVTLLLETPATGAFQFSSELHSVRLLQSGDALGFVVVAAQLLYLLFILYYMFVQGRSLKQQHWAYFRSKWNLLELAVILLSWSAMGVFIRMTLLGNHDVTYYKNHQDQFSSFYDAASTESQLEYVLAFLVLLATIKLWHLLRLNPNMYMITATLGRAWSDIRCFLVIMVVMFLAYCTASNVIYGWKLASYQTLDKTIVTLVGLQMSMFNYDEVLDFTPLLGGLLFGSCIVLMTFVVLNLLVSVILMAFHNERVHHKPSEEEEVVDVMLLKICSLFGIGYKATDNSPTNVKSSDLMLNSKTNVNSSSEINIHQASDNNKPRET